MEARLESLAFNSSPVHWLVFSSLICVGGVLFLHLGGEALGVQLGLAGLRIAPGNSSQFFRLSMEADNKSQKSPEESATTPPLPASNELEDAMAKNAKLLQERNDFEDKYKRALAEAENVRKRMLRLVEDAKLFGIQSFCKDLLEVADVLEKATESAPEDQLKEGVNPHFRHLFEGLKMTDAQLLKVFSKHSLHKIVPAIGDTFNPNIHEAVFTIPVSGENKPNTIAVIQKVGYSLHDRTLRPAYVGVFTA